MFLKIQIFKGISERFVFSRSIFLPGIWWTHTQRIFTVASCHYQVVKSWSLSCFLPPRSSSWTNTYPHQTELFLPPNPLVRNPTSTPPIKHVRYSSSWLPTQSKLHGQQQASKGLGWVWCSATGANIREMRTSTPSGLQILVHGYIRLSLIAICSLACLLNRSDDLQRVTSGYVPL